MPEQKTPAKFVLSSLFSLFKSLFGLSYQHPRQCRENFLFIFPHPIFCQPKGLAKIGEKWKMPFPGLADMQQPRAIAHEPLLAFNHWLIHNVLLILDKQGFQKFIRIERAQIVNGFANANKMHGFLQLFTDSDNHAAFGCAIQFCQNDS